MGNLLVMFLPFAFKLILFLVDLVAGLLLHLPFVSLIVYIFLGIKLLFFDHTDAVCPDIIDSEGF